MTVSCLVHSGLQCLYLVCSLHVYRLFTVTGISLVCSVVSLEFPLEVFTILQILLAIVISTAKIVIGLPIPNTLHRIVAKIQNW